MTQPNRHHIYRWVCLCALALLVVAGIIWTQRSAPASMSAQSAETAEQAVQGEQPAANTEAAASAGTGAARDGQQNGQQVAGAEASSADAATKTTTQTATQAATTADATDGEPQHEPSSEKPGEEVDTKAASGDEELFVPGAEGTVFCAGEVLISVDSHADPAAIEALLAQTPGLAAQSVSADQVAAGLVTAKLDAGVSVEEGLRALDAVDSPLVSAAQPNFIYTLAEDDVADDVVPTDAPDAEDAFGAEDNPGTEDASGVAVVPTDQAEPAQTDDASQGVPSQDDVLADEAVSDQATTPAAADANQNDALGVASAEVNDTRASEQWALKSLRAYDAWELAKCGDTQGPIAVAVLDNGFDIEHEDLVGNIIENSAYNSFYKTKDVSANNGKHGTHVMGIVGAVTNNQKGVAGMSYNAKIVPIKVFNNTGGASTASLVNAYEYILDHPEYNVRVVNLSVGAPWTNDRFEDDAFVKKVREAEQKNIATVVAACNSTSNHGVVPYYAYPSDSESVVSVMNLQGTESASGNDVSGQYQVSLLPSSNYNCPGQGGTSTNRGKNICAPGTAILSTIPNGYGLDSGTSMASPYVAGVMALEFAANPDLTVQEAIEVLYATAHDLGDRGWDERYGYGEADAYAAVRMALGASASAKVEGTGTVTASLTQPAEHYTYDGNEKKPDVTVTLTPDVGEEASLVKGEDYELEYTNNVDHGVATITVSGKGTYEGKLNLVLRFAIARRQLDASMATLSADTCTYDARSLFPMATVVCDGKELVLGTDYTMGFANNKNVGTARATISGVGNYCGTFVKQFTIVPRDLSSSAISMALKPNPFSYAGKACTPAVTLTHAQSTGGTYTLLEDDDYTVRYENNNRVGTATAIVSGVDNYKGERRMTFSIVPGKVAVPQAVAGLTYTGTDQTGVAAGSGYVLSGTTKATAVGSYTAKAKLTDATNYTWADGTTGEKTITWRIAAADVARATVAAIPDQAYTGASLTPQPVVTMGGRTLVAGTDYTVSYEGNVEAGTATVMIAGKGSYVGTTTVRFRIVAPHVVYRAHVQRVGWQGWKQDGAMSGTKGQSLRLEAIQIKLYGELAQHYDVYYRVHAQHFGWMGWAKNGDKSGTAGYAYRLEAIQIVLVPKGQPAPPATFQGITQNVSRAFRKR